MGLNEILLLIAGSGAILAILMMCTLILFFDKIMGEENKKDFSRDKFKIGDRVRYTGVLLSEPSFEQGIGTIVDTINVGVVLYKVFWDSINNWVAYPESELDLAFEKAQKKRDIDKEYNNRLDYYRKELSRILKEGELEI